MDSDLLLFRGLSPFASVLQDVSVSSLSQEILLEFSDYRERNFRVALSRMQGGKAVFGIDPPPQYFH